MDQWQEHSSILDENFSYKSNFYYETNFANTNTLFAFIHAEKFTYKLSES